MIHAEQMIVQMKTAAYHVAPGRVKHWKHIMKNSDMPLQVPLYCDVEPKGMHSVTIAMIIQQLTEMLGPAVKSSRFLPRIITL